MQEKVGNIPVDTDFKWVGTRQIRPDGMDKVTGRARFGADYNLPGQLVGRVLRSPHPHARIKSIDTSAAEALDGVKAIVTGADFPEQESKLSPASGDQLFMQQWCVGLDRLHHVYDVRQQLIFDLDQLQRLFRDGSIGRCDGCDRMALE